jgi:hypothetical protein
MTLRGHRYSLTAAIALLAVNATAEELRYSFALTEGSGTPVCEALLAAAQEAVPEVIGRCKWLNPSILDEPDLPFINWQVLRKTLDEEFSLPEWRLLDLADREDLSKALLARAAAEARSPDPYGGGEDRFWRYTLTPKEIETNVRDYIENGDLPYSILLDPTVLHTTEDQSFYGAEINYSGAQQLLVMTEKLTTESPSACANTYIKSFREILMLNASNLESNRVDDLLLFRDELFGVHYNSGNDSSQSSVLSLMGREGGAKYPSFSPTSICQMKIVEE